MKGVFKASLMSALLLAIVSLGMAEAKADPVTFSTSGTFTCVGCSGSGSNSVTFLGGMGNALLITFTGLGTTSLNTPTGSSFGNFQTFVSGNGPIAASGTFTLTITQTVPVAGSNSFSSTFTGLFSASNSGSGVVNFTTTAVTIGGISYSITNNPLNLVPPASNNGITTVQGQVTSAPSCSPLNITTVSASPNVLWPPNHKLVPITVSANTSNGCAAASCKILSVSSSEPLDADPDWVFTGNPGDLTLSLRAERLGSNNGRV